MPANALGARIGGEEIAIVADAAAALSPTRLLDDLRAQRMPYDVTITASIGGCTGRWRVRQTGSFFTGAPTKPCSSPQQPAAIARGTRG